jgi:hypothetical protein
MLRISSATGGKRACRGDRLLHPLVVRRAAPSSLRMIIRSIVEAARRLDNIWVTRAAEPQCGKNSPTFFRVGFTQSLYAVFLPQLVNSKFCNRGEAFVRFSR